MSRQAKAVAFSLALAVSFAYGLPQLLYFADGHPDALIQAIDEAPYVARVQEVMNGDWRVSDPYLWETKARPALLPYGAELVLGSIGTMLGLDIDAVIVAVRFIAPACLTLALIWFAFLVTQSVGWSVVAAAVVLLEPGTYYYKPFLYLTSYTVGYPDYTGLQLLYTRFHNPLVLAVPFVLAAAAVYRALQTSERRDLHIAAALVGLNLYTQVFYWAYLYAGMCILALANHRDTERVRIIVKLALLGLIWAGYALFEQVLRTQELDGQDLLTRQGLLLQTRAPIYLFPKALLAGGLVFALLSRPRDLPYWYLLSFLAGGYLLLNQHVITGREIQNYHFNYPNAVVFTTAMVLLAQRWGTAIGSRLDWRWRSAGAFGMVALVIWLVGNAVVLQASSYRRHMRAATVPEGTYPSNLKARFRGTLDWIRANTPADSVFLADPDLSFLVPIYTSGNVFLNPLQHDHLTYFISEPELFERWMIQLTLQGLTSQELFEEVRYRDTMPFLGWGYGRNEPLLAKYDFSTMKSFAQARQTDDLSRDYVREFEQFDGDQIPARLGKYRVDYVVVRDAAPRFRDMALTSLQPLGMRLVAHIEREGVTIYRIERHG